jgi:hypothetical protein
MLTRFDAAFLIELGLVWVLLGRGWKGRRCKCGKENFMT